MPKATILMQRRMWQSKSGVGSVNCFIDLIRGSRSAQIRVVGKSEGLAIRPAVDEGVLQTAECRAI
eukprot:scaffold14287_cov120-Skeletonema_menzelii.AAC.1